MIDGLLILLLGIFIHAPTWFYVVCVIKMIGSSALTTGTIIRGIQKAIKEAEK